MTSCDRAAIVGNGHTPFAKHLGRSECDIRAGMLAEAIFVPASSTANLAV